MLAATLGRKLIRLQCYEGLDEAKALYEWEYSKQLLYTQLLKDQVSATMEGAKSLTEAAKEGTPNTKKKKTGVGIPCGNRGRDV